MIAAELCTSFELSPYGLGQQRKMAAIFHRYFGFIFGKMGGSGYASSVLYL